MLNVSLFIPVGPVNDRKRSTEIKQTTSLNCAKAPSEQWFSDSYLYSLVENDKLYNKEYILRCVTYSVKERIEWDIGPEFLSFFHPAMVN